MTQFPMRLLAAAGALAAAGSFAACHKDPNHLELAGTVEARTVEVGSLVGGRIAQVHVREGDPVKAEQPVVTFEPDMLNLQIAEQRADVAQMNAALVRTEVGPRREDRAQLQVDFDNAETQRKRQQALLAGGAVSQQSYDDAAAKAAKALEALKAAQVGGRKEDVESSQAQLAAANEHLAFLERQRQELIVTAPATGLVETIDLRPGDLVPANSPVATLLEPDQIWVRVYVPEPQLGLVKVGQAAEIQVDSFPNRTFPGKVVEIRSQAEFTPRNVQTLDQRNDQVFGVKVEIAQGTPLKPGMSATVTLNLLSGPPAGPSSTPTGPAR
jgi:HlyD family secretion protein